MSTQLTSFEPYTDLLAFDPMRGFEDMLREFGRPGLLRRDLPQIRLDVEETDQAYQVSAEIPGVPKEDIKVEIDGPRVAITAERKRDTEQKHGNTLRSERHWGREYRSFTLQAPIDDAKVEAHYEHGVLKLTLPKKVGAGAKQVTIN